MSEHNGAQPAVLDTVPETPRLMAELWYDQVPDLDDPRLLAALSDVSAEAQLQDGSLTVPHSSVTMETETGVVPLLTVVLTGSPLDHDTKTLPDVSQTWDWPEVDEALRGCTGSVLVSELLANLFTPDQRVTGLMSVLGVLIAETRPRAIYWLNSQRVTDPARFDRDTLDGVLNVRFFTVGADEKSYVMDTLGLDLFELPDVQCLYRDFEPSAVAAMLFSTAAYLFGEGDVIDDGHTISGPRGDEHCLPSRAGPAAASQDRARRRPRRPSRSRPQRPAMKPYSSLVVRSERRLDSNSTSG